MTFDREHLRAKATDLAAQNVYIGTSSWKYPGWRGMLYDPARYEYRGKFAQTRFNRECLRECAEVFKTVVYARNHPGRIRIFWNEMIVLIGKEVVPSNANQIVNVAL